MRLAKVIALCLLSLALVAGGVPVPAKAKAPCPMAAKMEAMAKAGQPCQCPCCDKDGKDSCGDNDGCGAALHSPSVSFLDAVAALPAPVLQSKEHFDSAISVLASRHLLTQDRPPKQFS